MNAECSTFKFKHNGYICSEIYERQNEEHHVPDHSSEVKETVYDKQNIEKDTNFKLYF